MGETIFSRIIAGEVEADIVYEDESCLAFRDITPQAPTHILIIPKKPIAKIADADSGDRELLGHLILKAGEIARAEGVGNAFRLVINNGEGAGQSVFHLHLHLLAGRPLGWPPG